MHESMLYSNILFSAKSSFFIWSESVTVVIHNAESYCSRMAYFVLRNLDECRGHEVALKNSK